MTGKHYLYTVVTIALLLSFTGCEANPQGRKAVSGTVTVGDAPVAEGWIRFTSDPGNSVQIMTGAPIVKGYYSIPKRTGLSPGSYTVGLTAEGPTGKMVKEKLPIGETVEVPEIVNLIPDSYLSSPELKVTVSESGKAVFDFHIPTKK